MEQPKRARESQIDEIGPDIRQYAREFIDSDLVLLQEIQDAPSVMGVRALVLESFGLASDREHQLSQQQSAVLSEAVSRWSKAHSLGE